MDSSKHTGVWMRRCSWARRANRSCGPLAGVRRGSRGSSIQAIPSASRPRSTSRSRSVKLWFASSDMTRSGNASRTACTQNGAVPGVTFSFTRAYPSSTQRCTAASVSGTEPTGTAAPADADAGRPSSGACPPMSLQSGWPTILPYRSHNAGSMAPRAMGSASAPGHAASRPSASEGCRSTVFSTRGMSCSCRMRRSWSSVSGRYQSVGKAAHSPRPVRPAWSTTSTSSDSRNDSVPFAVAKGLRNGRRMRYRFTRLTSMRCS